MRRLILLVVCMTFLVSGCAIFGPDMERKVDNLSKRVSSMEKKQDYLEDQVMSDSSRSVTYVSENIVKKSVSSNIPLSKKEIQASLKNAGYYYGAIDGKIGKISSNAIREFQEDNGLKVDGIAGPKTQSLLRPYLSAIAK